MAEPTKGTSAPSKPAGNDVAAKTERNPTPVIVDKRSGRGKTDFTDQKTYDKNRNRLSNVRWKLGEEPYVDTEATDGYIGAREVDPSEVDESKWVNVKYEVVEHPDPDPNQKNLLRRGPKVPKLTCHVCGKPMYIAAAATAKKILEAGGYKFNPLKYTSNLDKKVVIAACEYGHVQQWREDFIERLMNNG